MRYGHRVFDRLARLRQPTIAVLSGHALGGGLELAAACDFRVAEAQVKLGFPETSIGVVPGWSGTQRAVRRFGAQAVRRMALGGEILLAAEALALGIVDRVVETGNGARRGEGLGRKDRRARAARHRSGQADDRGRRRRGERCRGRGAGQRLHRADRRSARPASSAFETKQKPAFSRSLERSRIDSMNAPLNIAMPAEAAGRAEEPTSC